MHSSLASFFQGRRSSQQRMVSPGLVAVVAVLMFSASQHAAHCQEMMASQITLQISQESIGGVMFCRLRVNGMESVLVNGRMSENFAIGTGVDVEFDNAADLVTITGRPNLDAMRYQYVVQQSNFHPFIIGSVTNQDRSGDMGFAVVYYDGSTVLFSNSTQFQNGYRQVEAACPDPPQQCNITTRRANDELVLQIPCSPRSENVASDDIMELTGSESIEIQSGETLAYSSNSLRYRRGSTTLRTFDNIDSLYFLEDVNVQGQSGQRLTRSIGMSASVFSGPGTLRVGSFAGGMNAFFSTSRSANAEVNAAVVDEQLTFNADANNNIVSVTDVFTMNPPPDNPLVMLGGMAPTSYRARSFPTASEIQFNNGAVTVTDRFGQSLASLSNFDSLSVFRNSEIQTFSGAMMSMALSLPSGGLTLYTNRDAMGTANEGFAFAGIESPVIQGRITTALDQIEVPINERPQFTGTAFSDGSAVLNGNGMQVVTLTDRAPVTVGSGQFVRFDGSNVRIFDRSDTNTPVSSIPVTDFTVFETVSGAPGSFYNQYNSTNLPDQDFDGPGTIYYDNAGRGFYTNDRPTEQFVSGFIASLPPARIDTVVRRVDGMAFVDIVNGDRQLVEVSTSSTTATGGNQGVIYVNDMLRTVNGYTVPADAQVVDVPSTVPGERIVQARDSNGRILFSAPSTGNYMYRMGNSITTPAVNSSFPGGGVIYFNTDGSAVVYNADTATSPQLVMAIANAGITFGSNTPGITELNLFNGQRVNTFTGMSSSFLQGPGTVYASGSKSLFSTDVARNGQIPGEVSQLLPVTFNVNTTTGSIEIVAGNGMSVTNFTVITDRRINIGGTQTVEYSNGFAVFAGNNISTSSFTYFNGFEVKRFGPDAEESFPGPGQVIISEETGEVTFIDDSTTIRRVDERVASTIDVFRPPVLVTPDVQILTSKSSDVTALFGQNVNVYSTATVRLRCRVIQSVPLPTFMFFRNGTEIDGTDDLFRIEMVSGIESVLIIESANISERYQCRASNPVGSASAFTDLRVRDGVAPMIINNYFPIVSGGPVVTARDQEYTREILVRDPQQTGRIPINDETLLNTDANIACKADGLPRPSIEWSATNGMAVPINESRVTVPRVGRSIYNVDVVGGTSTLFQCTATNDDEGIGLVRVTAISYACGDNAMDYEDGMCSVTCGAGIITRRPRNCFRRNVTVVMGVDFSEVPQGLFAELQDICFEDPCPEITYEYVAVPGECSKTCNRGFLVNNITCFRLVDGMRDGAVDDQFCDDFGVVRPPATEECNFDQCPRWVIESEYTPCSSTCAGGTQSRNVTCRQMQNVINETTDMPIRENNMFVRIDVIVNDSACPPRMPTRMKACNTDIPCPYKWYPLAWGPCEDFCQSRQYNCTRFDPSDPDEKWPVDPDLCVGPQPSPSVRSCGGGTCNRGEWISTTGPCSLTCGYGIRTVSSACFVDGQQVPDSALAYCDISLKPPNYEPCIIYNCPGRCDFEPAYCLVYGMLRLCKDFPPGVEECCKTCPLQASSFRTLPPILAQEDVVLSVQADGEVLLGTSNLEICCLASSQSGMQAFLNLPLACPLEAEIGNQMFSRVANIIPDTKDNIGCALFPGGGLTDGVVIEVSIMPIDEDTSVSMDLFNVTVSVPPTPSGPQTALPTPTPPPATTT